MVATGLDSEFHHNCDYMTREKCRLLPQENKGELYSIAPQLRLRGVVILPQWFEELSLEGKYWYG